eukprot:Gb_30577 [translate_table: standard]
MSTILTLVFSGSHFKTVVEYAPSQRVPKPWSKKDGREGAIYKDLEFLEFLDSLAKPAENLPSAEVQLERREAERAGGAKDSLIVTPLMDFVRQKRAAKSGSQRSAPSNGKLGRRAGGVSAATLSVVSHKRGLERRRMANATYVLRDNTRIASNKDKTTYVLVARREEQQHSESNLSLQAMTSAEAVEEDDGASLKSIQELTVTTSEVTAAGGDAPGEVGKKKMLLLKGKEKETANPQRRQMPVSKGVSSAQQPGGASHQQGVTSPVRGSPGASAFKQSQRREPAGRIVKGILSNKDLQQCPQSSAMSSQAEQQNPYTLKDEKMVANDPYAVATVAEKQDRRMRNKDRPDRPVWTPRRRSDGVPGSDESQSSIASASIQTSSEMVVPIRSQASLEGVSAPQQGVTSGFVGNINIVDDTFQQMDNSSGSSSAVPGKSRYTESSGSQSGRLIRLNTGVAHSSEQPPIQGELKGDMLIASRSGDNKSQGSGRTILVTGENGNHRQVMRRASALGTKDLDGPLIVPETKPSKRGGGSGYGGHEKQVWVAVQKSGSAS